MSYDYSENILVQESAGNLLESELGWEVQYAHSTEKLGENGTFGRRSYREVLLFRYLRAALKRFNPWLKEEQLIEAQRTLERHLSTSSLLQINEEKYCLLRDGIPVTVKRAGRTERKRAVVLDFQNPRNNHFLAIKELKIHGDLYRRRADIVGFVNGVPLLFVELKKPTVAVRDAYTDNYTDYLDTIPQLFYYNAFIMFSNGSEAKVGTLGSRWEFFHEWKRLAEADEGSVDLATMLRGICRKENFLDLLANFILYDHSGGTTAKILARNHQYLGVNEAVKKYAGRKLIGGKLGVFWHTQGSGKSYSMAFLVQKIRRNFEGSPTFVILTDREELNTQLSDTFENCGLLGSTKASGFIAGSGEDLRQKLAGNPGFIFTLIQKFNQSDVEPIYPDHDIIIMSDEAHRSQYGIFADNMMKLLPTAARIGFTGTPLFGDDRITERTFGGYVSVYDFKRAVEDGATVPLYYENRGEKIKDLRNPEINERILAAIERADLDESQREKLEAEFAKEIHLLTAEPRLRSVARDFVRHYSDLWTSGKAMFVCLNKVTCVRMYNYAQEYWQEEIEALKRQIGKATQQEAQELKRKLAWMEETEMAVVISQEQNEVRVFGKWGLDIRYHREKLEKRELDKEFKDRDNPLRIVFVCAMWLTGFDVKCLSCLYLDKPLKAHALMQAIARANRVSAGKSNGLIVDYIGIVKALREALAQYTVNVGRVVDPTLDKAELLERIEETIVTARVFLEKRGFDLAELLQATDFAKLEVLREAADIVCATLEDKKTFAAYIADLRRLMRYVARDDISQELRAQYEALAAIGELLQAKRQHVDNTDLLVELNGIVSEYVQMDTAEGVREGEAKPVIDISRIDFAKLQQEFDRVKKKNLLLRDLAETVSRKLSALYSANPGRIDYYERYNKIIGEYNKEQDKASIEETFLKLLALSGDLSEEEQRYVREGFANDTELALYDLLKKEDLSGEDIKSLKKVAADLLKKIRETLKGMDHFVDKKETRDKMKTTIRHLLYSDLPSCYDEDFEAYPPKIFEYVCAQYQAGIDCP